MKAVDAVKLQATVLASPLKETYGTAEDRISAYEKLKEEREAEEKAAQKEKEKAEKEAAREKKKTSTTKKSSGRKRQSALEKTVNSAATTIGREVGKKLIRGLFDTLLKG